MSAQTVSVRRVLSATCEEVFDAWLDADGMGRWMHPGPVSETRVTMEPRVGGRFRIVMDNGHYVHTGEYRTLDRPSRLQFTWVSSLMGNEDTLVTINLTRLGEGCELVLTHERFPRTHPVRQLEVGWLQIIQKLDAYMNRTVSTTTKVKGDL